MSDLYDMPPYDMPLWRPPSEGQNLIIQATLGCSFNACSFCTMYKTKTYTARPLDQVFADIDAAGEDWPDAHRVFLADGDALTLPTDHLEAILDKLAATFPALQRVSCYATPINLTKKSVAELARLKQKRLSLAYLGIESGSDDILKRIRKGTAKNMRAALANADEAGIKVSATVILGLGGAKHWREHILATAALINAQAPTYLSTLQLGLEEGQEQPFREAFSRGGARGGARGGDEFEWHDDAGILDELELLLESLKPKRRVIFRSNHASNCLALAGTLPKDGPRLVAQIRAARSDPGALRPQATRGF